MLKKLLAVLAIFTLCFAIMIPIASASEISAPYITDSSINAALNELDLPSISFAGDNDENYLFYVFKFHDTSKYELVRVYNYTGSYPDTFVVTLGGVNTDVHSNNFAYFFVDRYQFDSTKDSSWTTKSSAIATNDFSNYTGEDANYLYSTQDIYKSDGTLFFEVPRPTLADLVLGVIKGAIPIRLQTPVVGTMRILLLCGVGLIALLVGLKLFGKVLPQFLGRS